MILDVLLRVWLHIGSIAVQKEDARLMLLTQAPSEARARVPASYPTRRFATDNEQIQHFRFHVARQQALVICH